jgi:hypothetical protein
MAYAKDIEDVLADVLSVMTTGSALNNKIAEIEAEKVALGVGLSGGLAAIPSNGYFLQTWNDRPLNVNPAIFYGVEDDQVNDVGSGGMAQADTYRIFISAIVIDNGMSNDNVKRVFRYSKALRQLFSSQAAKELQRLNMEISLVKPTGFNDINTNEPLKVGGIELKVTLFN